MSKEFVTFVAKSMVVVSGGYLGLKGQWVPELKMIDGYDHGFLILRKEDRGLAAAMGRNCSEIRPLHNVSVFGHIAKLRDEGVDELIRVYNASDEPMVDTGAGEIRIKNREKEFQAANIAEVIDIKFAAITTPIGTKLEPMALHVVSTPRRGVNPCIMISPSVLEWPSYVIDCMELSQTETLAVSLMFAM